jgi:hypothetical protein
MLRMGSTPGGQVRAGAVVVVDVRNVGRPLAMWRGERAGDSYGAAVARVVGSAGETTSLLVGAPGLNVGGATDAGRVYATTLDGLLARQLDGPEAGARIGASAQAILPRQLESGGVFVGAPEARGGRGLVVIYGIDGALRSWLAGSDPGDRLLASISPAADFDGNGREEVAVAAPGSGSGSGRVLILTTSGTILDDLRGPIGSAFGRTVATPGDVDRDGSNDLLVGAPGLPGDGARRGAWFLLSGMGGNPNPPGDPVTHRRAHPVDRQRWFGLGIVAVVAIGLTLMATASDELATTSGADRVARTRRTSTARSAADGGQTMPCRNRFVPSDAGQRRQYIVVVSGVERGRATMVSLREADGITTWSTEIEVEGRPTVRAESASLCERDRSGASVADEPWYSSLVPSNMISRDWRWPAELDVGLAFGGTVAIGGASVTRRYVVVGRENVLVPSGRFDCWRVDYTDTVPDEAGATASEQGSYWVAEELGLVRSRSLVLGSETVWELTEVVTP